MTYSQEDVDKLVAKETQKVRAEMNKQILDEQNKLIKVSDKLKEYHAQLQKYHTEAVGFGVVLEINSTPDPKYFIPSEENDVLVIDKTSPYYKKSGRILSIPEDNNIKIKLLDESVVSFALNQVKLVDKPDGTWTIVLIAGTPFEVLASTDTSIKVGDQVKIDLKSRQIISKAKELKFGRISQVTSISEGNRIEIGDGKGENRIIFNPKNFPLNVSDRVLLDFSDHVVCEVLPEESRSCYQLITPSTISWDEIGGLEEAKQETRESIEYPFQNPEIYKKYGITPPAGILYYGPQGCGKTLLVQAAANSYAKIHGQEAVSSGYIYVKGPQILNMYVGNTEKEIRMLFDLGRKHFKDHGYKAFLVIDEADALLPTRGTRRSSDISDTIVPMFLSEMQGVDEDNNRSNPIVFLLTNRVDIIDPAIVRKGRIDKHIKVDRPGHKSAISILKIHAKDIPLAENTDLSLLSVKVVAELFSKSRILYKINGQYDFTLENIVNGAIIKNLVLEAKMFALRRDMKENKFVGITLQDFESAIDKIYQEQRSLNHTYDLHDFNEKHGLSNPKVERLFASK